MIFSVKRIIGLAVFLSCLSAHATLALRYDFPTLAPFSDFLELPSSGLTAPFCAEWNPDFTFHGGQCCAKVPRGGSNRGGFCPAARAKNTFCDERTDEQTQYIDEVEHGKIADPLEALKREIGRGGYQAFCSPNNGFLAWGRPVVPTALNRLILKSPQRCTNFGTDGMAGMLEWVGRKIGETYKAPEYSVVKVVIGDISAPRGGCLKGSGGRRGHSSHMSGQDVDMGFLSLERRGPATVFEKKFDPDANWWMIKQIFHNPFACVKMIFLDRKLIGKLRKVAQSEPEWQELSSRIRHVRNHKNHMHVRIGEKPGAPGCTMEGDGDEEEEG